MAIQWGSWDYGNSSAGFRVGVEVTQSAVSNGSASVTFTTKWYVEAMYNVDDLMTVTWGGSLTGSSEQNLTTGSSGGSKLWATKTYVYSYSTYGTSPGTRTFTGSLSGVYNSANPTKSVTVTIPARPYAGPAAPSAVTQTRNSDTQHTVTWTRNATTGAPYTSVTVQRRVYSGGTWSAYATVATTTSTATSFVDTTVEANKGYQYQVKSNNSVGSSAYVATVAQWNTPAAPSNVVSSLSPSGTAITTTWTNNNFTSVNVTFTIQRSVAGGAFANVATGVASSLTSYTDNTPGAGTNQYRIAASHTVPATTSAYATGNTVSTTVPPLAPTLLSPNGVAVDWALAQTLTWQHNPGGDQAAQSSFIIEYSNDSGANWLALNGAGTTSTASSYTVPAGTLTNGVTRLWRVRTRGIASAGYGPNSASATLIGSATPVVTITSPPATVTTLPMTATWTYSQAQSSAQVGWELTLSQGGTVVETKIGGPGGTGGLLTTPLATQPLSGTYVLSVRSQSAAGLWSAWATRTLTISLLPPGGVLVNANYQNETGTTILDLTVRPAPGATRTNQFTNPSIEANLTNLTASAVTLTRDNLWADDGSWSARTMPSTASNDSYVSLGGLPASINTPGTVWTISAKPYAPAELSGTPNARAMRITAHVGAGNTTTVVSTTDPLTGREVLALTVPAGTTSSLIRLYNGYSNSAENAVHWDSIVVESGATAGDFFDGDSGWGAWTGTKDASTSTLAAANGVATISAKVERRVPGGDWVTLINGVALPASLIDLLPSTTGTNEYRVTAASATPTYREEPILALLQPDPLDADDAHLRQWIFLNYGDSFEKVLRTRSQPQIGVSTGREKEGNRFAGRTKPRLAMGQARSRAITVGSGLVHRAMDGKVALPDGNPDSPPSDWEVAGLESEVVCYRDFLGRRVFGYISDVSVDDTAPGRGTVGFTVTESDYTEVYG